MTAVIVIVAAIAGSAALYVVWNWAVDRVVDRQGRRFEEAMRGSVGEVGRGPPAGS